VPLCGFKLKDNKKNTEIRGLLGLDPVSLTIKRGSLRWFGHVEHEDDADWLKRCMKMECEGTRQRGRPRKTWWDCVKTDMEFWPVHEDAHDRDYWRLRIKGEPANPGLPGKRPLKRYVCVRARSWVRIGLGLGLVLVNE